MGLLGKLIAGKLMAKAAQNLNRRSAAAAAARGPVNGRYVPATAGASAAAPTGLAGKAVSFYERNPKLVAGAATLLMAAVAASLTKGKTR